MVAYLELTRKNLEITKCPLVRYSFILNERSFAYLLSHSNVFHDYHMLILNHLEAQVSLLSESGC